MTDPSTTELREMIQILEQKLLASERRINTLEAGEAMGDAEFEKMQDKLSRHIGSTVVESQINDMMRRMKRIRALNNVDLRRGLL